MESHVLSTRPYQRTQYKDLVSGLVSTRLMFVPEDITSPPPSWWMSVLRRTSVAKRPCRVTTATLSPTLSHFVGLVGVVGNPGIGIGKWVSITVIDTPLWDLRKNFDQKVFSSTSTR